MIPDFLASNWPSKIRWVRCTTQITALQLRMEGPCRCLGRFVLAASKFGWVLLEQSTSRTTLGRWVVLCTLGPHRSFCSPSPWASAAPKPLWRRLFLAPLVLAAGRHSTLHQVTLGVSAPFWNGLSRGRRLCCTWWALGTRCGAAGIDPGRLLERWRREFAYAAAVRGFTAGPQTRLQDANPIATIFWRFGSLLNMSHHEKTG